MDMFLASPTTSFLGGMRTGNALAAQRRQGQMADMSYRVASHQDSFTNALRTAMQGGASYDQAINALAGQYPLKVREVQGQQAAAAQKVQIDKAKLQALEQDVRIKAEQHALNMTEAERKQEIADMQRQGRMVLAVPAEHWPDFARAHGYPEYADPALQAVVAMQLGVTVDTLLKFDERNAPPEADNKFIPQVGIVDMNNPNPELLAGQYQAPEAEPADEYGRYVAEETAAGRQPLTRIEYAQAKKGGGFQVTTADGTTVTYGTPNQKPNTESSRRAAGFLSRMKAAEGVLGEIEADGQPATRSITSLLAAGTNLEGLLLSDQQGRILQAQRDWVRAKLRLESGAVIGDEEMAEEIRTYFPLPGEGPNIVEQKRRSRLEAERQLGIMAGADTSEPVTGASPGMSEGQSAADLSGMSASDLVDWADGKGGLETLTDAERAAYRAQLQALLEPK